ncbi:hydroxyethylthiazole kinase [Clostridium swellfunianum]|uniref:hydroxyethylthiazole kinase n=1 Tax=Clostridium swellfunianum TaxID=1367462 RepID=UPI00202EF5C7|nr:hydroxyethylthiazole kinase [Clostridium swellfunianum]MCM0647764.1 hydroxyethylthiazole kinase [Clostridium swellfunianum]
MEASKRISKLLYKLREKKPLVHHLTNYVTVNDCANITLAIGGSPVMADDINEVRDMVSLASSLVINIGTLNSRTVEAMLEAGKRANELGVPVVLDPVGAGATSYRTETAKRIMNEIKLSVIRGNLSEIKTLYGIEAQTRGVDSSETFEGKDGGLEAVKKLAKDFALRLNTIIAITGAIDIITDGTILYSVENGHETMSKITGTGCMCTSLIGSYLGAGEDKLLAALSGVVSMGIAGEIAYESLNKKDEGTGTLKVKLIDAIFNLCEENLCKRSKINEA